MYSTLAVSLTFLYNLNVYSVRNHMNLTQSTLASKVPSFPYCFEVLVGYGRLFFIVLLSDDQNDIKI